MMREVGLFVLVWAVSIGAVLALVWLEGVR